MAVTTTGSWIGYGNASTYAGTTAWIAFPCPTTANATGTRTEMVDISTFCTNGLRTFMAGLKDNGSLNFTFHYSKNLLTEIKALEGVERGYVLVFSDGGFLKIDGILEGIDFQLSAAAQPITIDISIRVNALTVAESAAPSSSSALA